MQYLTAGDIARMNAWFVGEDVPFDFALLESATLRPVTTIGDIDAYPTVHDKAAALFHSLIRSHPFVDGNKRTAVTAVYVFYRLNGWRLVMDDDDLVALALDVAEGIVTVEGIAKAFASGVVEQGRPEPDEE